MVGNVHIIKTPPHTHTLRQVLFYKLGVDIILISRFNYTHVYIHLIEFVLHISCEHDNNIKHLCGGIHIILKLKQ